MRRRDRSGKQLWVQLSRLPYLFGYKLILAVSRDPKLELVKSEKLRMKD